MTRKTNQELAAEFRNLLTHGAKDMLDAHVLELTKPWRAELWRAFNEIEDRLDPLRVEARNK